MELENYVRPDRFHLRPAILSALILLTCDASLAWEPVTLDQILDRACQAEKAFQEKLQDYICQAISTIGEPQDGGTVKTIRVVKKTIYRKLPDKRLEHYQSVVEGGRILTPQEMAKYQSKRRWEYLAAGRQFFSPEHRANYSFELLPPDSVRGLPAYALRLTPMKREKTLVSGMIWLHQDNFEILKLDIRPAESPRFVKEIHMIIDFDEVQDGYWLPVEIDIQASGGLLFIKKHFCVHETWDQFQINTGLPDSIFYQQH